MYIQTNSTLTRPYNYELCIKNYALFIVSLMSLDRSWLDVHLLALQQ